MRYKKRPVVVEAVQISQFMLWPDWFHDAVSANKVITHGLGKFGEGEMYVEVVTLEGVMRGDIDDWIIQGVKGELYPCKPDVFAALYDEEPTG